MCSAESRPYWTNGLGQRWRSSAAIRILSETGLISHLSFGAETTDLTLLSTLADILAEEPAAYRSYLAENLAEGLGFAAARALALETMTGQSLDIMHRPNTILALEYLKALKQQKSDIIPVPVLRQGDYHDSDSVLYPSASSIRDRFGSGEAIRAFIPEGPCEVFKQAPKAKVFDTWSDILYDRMLHHTAETLRTIRDVEEGLEGRLLSVLDRPMPLTEAVEKLSTKRYPKARIRRILLAILLDIKKEEVQNKNPGYIRVLGFRKEAEPLISAMAKNAKVPVITNLNRQMKDLPVTLQEALRKEMLRTDLYYAHVDDPPASVRAKDLTQPLILI